MSVRPAQPPYRGPVERLAEARALAAAVTPFVRSLRAQLPPGVAGERLRRRLAALLALPSRRRVAELPEMLAAITDERRRAGEDGDAVHAALRTLVHEHHAVLLRAPALAHWLEAPERRSAMLAWLVRDSAERVGQLQDDVPGESAGIERLHAELAQLEAEHRLVVRELERRRALSDVGLLAAGIVHDFNNLLHAIAGQATLVRTGAGERERAAMDQILEITHRASDLTRHLLQWVRHERTAPEPLDLSVLASEVIDLLAPSAPVRVLLVRRLGAGLPPVLADPVELRRVVLNLVVNAWQAIGTAAGEVVVATGATAGRDGGVWIEVADDGRGMDADTSARVFEPFFSTRPDGTGLGLASVREIVERMHGAIQVWSEPGRGARFRVTLPAMGGAPRA